MRIMRSFNAITIFNLLLRKNRNDYLMKYISIINDNENKMYEI